MKLTRYGIQLETLTAEHLEMVRLWRNQDYIRSRMQYQQVLTSEDQLRWFKHLDPEKNLYWVFRHNDYPIGLVHIKDIAADGTVGEAGVFTGAALYLESPQPILAILFMMEIAFYVIGIEKLKAKIHHENVKAIRFNLQLGYQLVPDQAEGFQYYEVDKARFENFTRSLRSDSQRLYGSSTSLSLSDGEPWHAHFVRFAEQQHQAFMPIVLV
jgi:RimJ/RimL family protein N-acetyltransferase